MKVYAIIAAKQELRNMDIMLTLEDRCEHILPSLVLHARLTQVLAFLAPQASN
jgi:hypothetical protein